MKPKEKNIGIPNEINLKQKWTKLKFLLTLTVSQILMQPVYTDINILPF